MKEHLGPVGEPHHLALNKLMTRTLTTSRVSPLDKNMTLKKKQPINMAFWLLCGIELPYL